MSHPVRVLVATAILAAGLSAQEGAAVYEVTFQSTWSKSTHPVNFPSPNEHYTPIVGVTHNASVTFWKPGGLATAGVKSMAEDGDNTTILKEYNAAITAGTASSTSTNSTKIGSPTMTRFRFVADASHPKYTAVTMLGPSPDWFVGLSSVDLVQSGRWVDKLTIPATLWDAGTDSGADYNSSDSATVPQAKIAVVSTASGPFKGYSTQVGTWTLMRVYSRMIYGCGVNPTGSMRVAKGEPALGQTLQFELHDPGKSMPSGALAFLLISGLPPAGMPCGAKIPGFGMGASGTAGEFLLGNVAFTLVGPPWKGTPVAMSVPIPFQTNFMGLNAFVQGGLAATTRLGLTDAVELSVGR